MSAPSEALNLQSMRIRPMQRLTTSIEPTITLHLVTNAMKLMEGTAQAATRVKVLSPEIANMVEADVFHHAESSTKDNEKVSYHSLYRGLSPWHELRWKLSELGRSSAFFSKYAITSQQRRVVANNAEEVGLTDSTWSMGKPCTWGSGQQYRDWLRTCFTIHRGRKKMKVKLNQIAKKAKQDKHFKFTSLIHHVNVDNLALCYQELKRDKACGIDGVTVEEYGRKLQENLELLVEQLKAKRYRSKPVRRVYIPKIGKPEKRSLGIPSVEDKLVQIMLKKILESIFESNFLDCSYGFRPNRSCHTAINTLDKTVMTKPVNFVVEVDIKNFFD